MDFRRDHHPWTLPHPPPGLAVWPSLMGRIVVWGRDGHDTLMDHPVPHIVLSGRGRIRNSQGDWSLQAGDLFCLWPGVRCQYACDPDAPWNFCWMHLHDAAAADYVAALGFRPSVCVRRPRDPAAVRAIGARLFAAFAKPTPAAVPGIAADLQALVLAAGAPPQTATEPDLVAEALRLARALLHSGVNVNDLAAALGCSRTTLLRAFRRRLGESPVAALNRLRLERAVELLRGTDHSVETVAHLVGYGSGQYLIRRCREDLGRTPTALRQGR